MAALHRGSVLLALFAALLPGCSGAGSAARPAPQELLKKLPPLSALPAALKRQTSNMEFELLYGAPVVSSGASADFTPGSLTLTPPDAQTMAYAVFGLSGL